jgi:hypothetical protein
MPGPHPGHEVPLGASRNIEPPDRMIRLAARPMQLAASYTLTFEDCLQLSYICSILLHELDINLAAESRGMPPSASK